MEEDIIIRSLARIAASTFQTSALLIKFLTHRVIDLFCLLLNIIAVCTIIRLPALFHCIRRRLRYDNDFPTWIDLWHFLGIFQVGVFIIDLPFVLMSLPLMVFFWRAVLLLREHGPIKFEREGAHNRSINAWGYTGWRLRTLVWKHFCLLCTDFFFIPFSVSLLLSWRSSRFRRLILDQYTSGNESAWKKMIVKEFLMLCNEIICFPIITIFLLSWRSKRTRIKIMHSTGTQSATGSVMSDFEILCSLAEIDSLADAFFSEWGIVISEGCNLFLDICTLPILSLSLLSWRFCLTRQILKPWYINNLARNISGQLPISYENEIRKKIWGQFLNLVMDLFYVPPLVLTLFSWRVVPFCRSMVAIYLQESIPNRNAVDIRNLNSHQEQLLDIKFQNVREQIICQCVSILTDVVSILALWVILMLSVVFPWRLCKVWQEFRSNNVTEKSMKSCIFNEFVYLVRDIPTAGAGMIIILTLWRLPFLLSELVKIVNSDSTARRSNLVTSCVFRQLILLVVDILVAPFLIVTLISIWRFKPFIKRVQASKTPLETSYWQWFMVSYDGYVVRKAALIHCLSLIFVDLPCFGLLLVNICMPFRISAIVSTLINSSNFYQEYPIVLIAETLNLLVDLIYMGCGLVLFVFRPVALTVHLLEDERHRKARELGATIGTIQYLLRKTRRCADDLEDMVNVLVKASSSIDENLCKFLLSEITVEYTADMQLLKTELANKYVDDRFIHLISKYLFLFDKQGYFMHRRFLVEKLHLKRPSYYARLQNLDLFHREYSAYLKQLKKTESEILEFAVDAPPLWSESVGILLRTRKENHAVIMKTLTTGYFATVSIVVLNCVFIYRAFPLLLDIINEPYMIRKKAKANLMQYWLDLQCLAQILLVILSIYRCPDLVSDLIVDIFYKRSISAVRKTVAVYPPKVKEDFFKCLKLLFRWRFIAYLMASVLFFCFIPLSALVSVGKAFSSDMKKVVGGIFVTYVAIVFIPLGIIFDNEDKMTLLEHQMFEYLCGVSVVLILFLSVSAKKPRPLPPVDYVRINWGLIHVIIHEACQLGQILALLFRLSPVIDPARKYHSIFRLFLFETDDPEISLTIFNAQFYCWFFISSAPVVLEGILKYSPQGQFSNNNFSWQFLLSLMGSVTFAVIPYLGTAYLCKRGDDGTLIWYGEPYVAVKCLIFLVWYLLTSVFFYCQYFNSTNPMFDLHFSPVYNSAINIIKLVLIFSTVLLDLTVITKIVFMLVSVTLMIAVTTFYPHVIATISSLENQQPCNSGLLKCWRLSIFVSALVILLLSLLTENFPSLVTSGCDVFIPLVLVTMLIYMTVRSVRCISHSADEESRNIFMELVKDIEVAMRENSKESVNWNKTRNSWLNLLRVARLANEQEKQAEKCSEELFLEPAALAETAPPDYDQVGRDKGLPSYQSVNTFEPPPEFSTGNDFLPDMEYLTSPVGIWQPYSAAYLVQELSYLSGHCDLTQTITDQKCTGSNILLILERHIHYSALTRTCVQKLVVWRTLVANSDWPGLVKYARMLKRALTCEYDVPTQAGIVEDLMEDDFLKPLADNSFFPSFVENETLFDIKLRLHRRSREALLAVLPRQISLLFAQIISEDFPTIRMITQDASSKNIRVTCEFFKANKVTIVSVPGEGFKVAAGSSLEIPKTLVLEKISDDCVIFSPPYLLGNKYFLSVSIPMFKTFDIDGTIRIGINDDSEKTVELEKAVQTLTNLKWK